MSYLIQRLADKVISGDVVSYAEAQSLLSVDDSNFSLLLSGANRIRQYFRGSKVNLCSITNAKSGACSQDCRFCAQSKFNNTSAQVFPLIDPEEMLKRAGIAFKSKTQRFCLVTSGESLSDDEIDIVCSGLRLIRNSYPALKLDASLGLLTREKALKLKRAGLSRYNHNLETSRDYFKNICTTHTFQERVDTLFLAKEAGLEICCGGIFGLGESEEERLRLAFNLRDLDVDCIPVNFLNPISGTPLENQKPILPEQAFKIIAILRFVNPAKEIKVCGGRQAVLKENQSKIFFAGADSIILGDYLTTKGSSTSEDFRLIKSAGLRV